MRSSLLFGTWLLYALASAYSAEPVGLANEPFAASDWVVRTWQVKDGLPQNTVYALAQTRDGYLWIGTSSGLARFDGVRFRTFGLMDGLRSVQVLSLHEDPQGVLWVGTVGGGVSRWENGRFATLAEAEGFPPANAQALAGERDGTLWVGTERGLTRWRDGKFKMMGVAEGLPAKQVRALLLDSRGVLWVSVLLDGLYRGTNGRFSPVPVTAGAPSSAYCLTEDRDGNVWAGSNLGRVWRWRDGVWATFGPSNGLPKSVVETLVPGAHSPLWVGTRNGGLGFLSEGKFHDLKQAAALSDETVRAMTVDREGTVWAGTASAGLRRLSRRVLHAWGTADGLPQAAVNAIAELPSGELWVCTPNRGIYVFREGRFSKLDDPAVSTNYPFLYAAEVTADGSVWAAGEQGLFRFRTNQKTETLNGPPVKGEAIRALCADGTNLWLGTYYSTLLKFDGTAVRTMATNGSFAGGITSLVREGPDTLWIGTSAGLYRWEQGTVKSWGTRDGLLAAFVRTLHRDPDGTLWIGTLGGGLARLKDGRFANITTRHGLIDDVISQIVPDDYGHLWLGCNRGLMRLDRRDLDDFANGRTHAVHPVAFGANEGMIQEQCSGGHSSTALKAKDGRLLFATMGGIVEMDPRRLQGLTPLGPEPRIEEILVDERRWNLQEPLVIPPGHHRVEVSYSALSLPGGDWLRFRTRLEGLDDDWVQADSRRMMSYAGLRPGQYVFRVTASDSRGVWSPNPASLELVVQPFFWQTSWFVALVVMLLGGAAFPVYRWRIARVESRRLAQEAFTWQLITAQEAERARLARELHDDITQRLALLAIDAGRVESGKFAPEVGETMRALREGLVRLSEDVHALSYRLHSSLLEDLGLAEALRAECERFASQESIPCALKLQDVADSPPREAAFGLFRVTQEALRNVARHAHARAVEVTLRHLDDGLQLCVHDNGIGFDPSRKRGRVSLGLASMRERMQLLGGELDIESAPGHGVTILAWVPSRGNTT